MKLPYNCIEVAPSSTDRMVTIRGQPDVIRACIVDILHTLSTVPPRGPTNEYDPDCYDASYDYGGYANGLPQLGLRIMRKTRFRKIF